MKKSKFTSLLLAVTIALTPATSLCHGGRTDYKGGHEDNKNASGLGYYNYHCGGHPAHLHQNVCNQYVTYKTCKLQKMKYSKLKG